jgi:hypothetical protein
LEGQLRGQLVGIIRKAQAEVFLSYRSSDGSRELTGTSPSSSILEAKETATFQPTAAVSAAHGFAATEASLMQLGEGGVPSELDSFGRDLAALSRMEMGLATSPNATDGDGGILRAHENEVNMMEGVQVSYETDITNISRGNAGGGLNSTLFPGNTELESWYANAGFQFTHT